MAAEGSSRPVMREPQSEQEVIDIYQKMRTEVNNIWQKINEMEMELQEHGLVLQTLEPLEKDRKCFRLIGGVLVERTVGEVAPAVKKNKEGIAEMIGKLETTLAERKTALAAFQAKYKIKMRGEADVAPQQEKKEGRAPNSAGVLVSQ